MPDQSKYPWGKQTRLKFNRERENLKHRTATKWMDRHKQFMRLTGTTHQKWPAPIVTEHYRCHKSLFQKFGRMEYHKRVMRLVEWTEIKRRCDRSPTFQLIRRGRTKDWRISEMNSRLSHLLSDSASLNTLQSLGQALRPPL